MPLEIEAKMKLDDHGPLIERLRSVGAVSVGRFFEINVFFDNAMRTMLTNDQGLRLRTLRNEETGATQFIITHKGPRLAGKIKSREETEFSVSDAESAERLLAKLGYTPRLRFEKRRWTWALKDCKVELDELPELGRFVEIEGKSHAVILQVRDQLGLASRELIDKGYSSMLARLHPGEEGLIDVRFTSTG